MSAISADALTLVIPTHERPNRLNRALHSLAEVPWRVLVADSSARVHRFSHTPVPDRLEYRHVPGEPFLPKLSAAFCSVRSPWVALHPDDDFLVPEGLEACLDHLRNHPEVAVCHGRTVLFREDPGQTVFQPTYQLQATQSVTSADPAERVQQVFRPYHHQVYGVQRTARVQTVYRDLLVPSSIRNENLMELLLALTASVEGPIHHLPCFLVAREHIATSSGFTVSRPLDLMATPQGRRDIGTMLRAAARYYEQQHSVSLAQAKAVMREGLRTYFRDYLPCDQPWWSLSSNRRMALADALGGYPVLDSRFDRNLLRIDWMIRHHRSVG